MIYPHSNTRMLVGILASGALFYVSTGLDGISVLAWVAPIPALVTAFKLSGRAAAVTAFLAFVMGSLNMVSYLARLAPTDVVVSSVLIPSLAFMLSVLAARVAAHRTEHWVSVFAFPVVWTAYEFLLSLVSPHGSAGSLAYTQTTFLSLAQIASVTGIYGMTFVLMLIPASLALAWWHLVMHQSFSHAFLPALVIGGLTLGFGWIRLAWMPSGPHVRVGLAVTDTTVKYFDTQHPEEAIPVVQAYVRRVGQLAAQGATVVVLPEKLVGVTPAYRDTVFALFRNAARTTHTTVIAGINQVSDPPLRNTALVFSPDGRLLTEYDKAFLVPGFEATYQAGTEVTTLPLAGGKAGVAICKDMDFPRWLRLYGQTGTGLMLVPAWDFVQDGHLHMRMAVMRGIENGCAVARVAQEGLATISDHHGRILAEAASGSAPEVLVAHDISLGPGWTLYSVLGDWFGWLMVAALVGPGIWQTRKRRRAGKGGQPAAAR